VHALDARVGGQRRLSFRNFTTGNSHAFGGEHLELLPFQRICYIERFDDPNFSGLMRVTVEFRQVSCGTEIDIVQEGIPESIPIEMCYLGWQESLEQFGRLVEPEIAG
jgi:uncharacterized protein YndB with AHSA1/START domain